MLCQCSKAIHSPNTSQSPTVIRKKPKIPYVLPTASYLAMAQQQEGNQKQNLLLLAAARMIADGQWQRAFDILAQTHHLTASQADEKNLLLAKGALMRDKPKDALAKLASIKEANKLTLYHQIQFHELLAQSYRATERDVESISERIQLESLLEDEESQANNRRNLWLTLMHLPKAELNTLAMEVKQDSELQGWLELALISRTHSDNSLLAALEQWQARFSSHSANHILPIPLDSIANKMHEKPKQIALLLPLSASLSGPANAIRKGFMGAYKADKQTGTQVKVYDTEKDEVAHVYQQAIKEGADYVVGPLTKGQVTSIAALPHPVPTLLLNDSEALAQDNSYSFSLSPSNEATQVAIKARSKGYAKALIITPQNDWGNEIAKVFSKQWQSDGGQIVATLSYNPNDDMNKKMRDFLHINESQAREKELKQLLGQKLQASNSRRQDFDMIFLLAYPSKARQIMPLLKYYYAGDVPVYATSSVYSGNADSLKDKDLDGIIFCDIPWVFAHQMGTGNWPEQFNSYNRLYALGMDSYALATQWNPLILFPAENIHGTSGTLYLKPSQQIARILEWGQFRQGLARSLGEAT